FDVRWLLREIALSKTYQRSSVPPPGVAEVPPASFAAAALRPLAPEALAFGLAQAAGLTDAERRCFGEATRGRGGPSGMRRGPRARPRRERGAGRRCPRPPRAPG